MGQRRRFGRQAGVLAAVCSAVLLAGLVQLILGPGQSGITTDEPIQLFRAGAWLGDGDYIPPFGADHEGASSKYVYGPAYSALAHGVNLVAGNESGGSISFAENAFLTRHLVSALLALLTAIVAGVAVGFATGSRILGLWAAAALLAIPIWIGMGFFNPKDTPVAAGYTFFTAALICAFRRNRDDLRFRSWDLLVFLLAGAGVYFSAGTRLAMWLPMLLSLLVFVTLVVISNRIGEAPVGWPAVLAGTVTGFVGLAILYPAAFGHPAEFLTRTLSDSSEFDWTGYTLTYARLLPEHPPWWYLPAWSFASVPVLIGLAAFGGFLAILRRGWQVIRRRLPLGSIGLREKAAVLILVQLLLLPCASVLAGSTMYTGLRQHLYLIPAVAMLAAIGISYLLDWNEQRPSSEVRSWLITAGLCLALVLPMVEQIKLFPFNYTYVNPVAGIQGVNDRWEGDYWGVSLKEASERVPEGRIAYCGDLYAERPFDPESLAPCSNLSRPYALQDESDRSDPPGTRWTLLRRRSGAGLPEACTPAGAVTRDLRGETIVMSYVARC